MLSFCSHIILSNRLRATSVYFSLLAVREAVTLNQTQRSLYEIPNFNGGSSRLVTFPDHRPGFAEVTAAATDSDA